MADKGNKVRLVVLNPRGELERAKPSIPAPRIADLNGKTVGLYSNGKHGMDNFYTVFEELLKQRFPAVKVKKLQGAFEIRDEDAQAWVNEVDTFVYGVGD
ncbi:MAG TPA: hypothetical protein GX699_11135 [Firmicutes bacterium]|nr:hypothetical protein [Bacillota bacterium]